MDQRKEFIAEPDQSAGNQADAKGSDSFLLRSSAHEIDDDAEENQGPKVDTDTAGDLPIWKKVGTHHRQHQSNGRG